MKIQLIAFVILQFLATYPVFAGDVEIPCYSITDDVDHDGYARSGAHSVMKKVNEEKKLRCPAGYIRMGQDCDDTNPSIHPFLPEVPFNGIDDNCRDGIDEPEAVYSASGNGNSANEFNFTVRINDSAIVTAADTSLYAEVEYVALQDSNHQIVLPRQLVRRIGRPIVFVTVKVPNLSETTVFRAKMRFFPTMVGGTQIGRTSTFYYTTTDGLDDKSIVRTKMLLKGFKEFDESQKGRIGYAGTVAVDGTRYGASRAERWCSEFYVYTAKDYLKGIANMSSVDRLVNYFAMYDTYHGVNDLSEVARRGDYLAMDTSDTDSHKKNHSGMFLAYDLSRSSPVVWALEGNWGNRVLVKERNMDEIAGVGHIARAQLK